MGQEVLKKNSKFYISIALNIVDGILSGCNIMALYLLAAAVVRQNLTIILIGKLSAVLAASYILRLAAYGVGYTQGQIGGAAVSKNIRIKIGDKLKKIPLSLFTQGLTGDYVNVVTADINNYEKVLTHKAGDIIKNIAFTLMLIIFAIKLFPMAGVIMTVAELCLIPALFISFRAVNKYGDKKNKISAQNVSNIIEHIEGSQTYRAYGIGGTRNSIVNDSMKAYRDISYTFESKIIPLGMVYSIITWMSLPIIILTTGSAFLTGTVALPEFLIVCILPIIFNKLLWTIFEDLTHYKSLVLSRNKIIKMMEMEEETGRGTFKPKDYSIEFANVSFSYLENEPVLQNVSFRVEGGRMAAIVGDSGSGKSTILNLLSKYYKNNSGEIYIGGENVNKVAAEEVHSVISMVDQDVFLFDDTVMNNIRYARNDATDGEIINACKLANCDHFIMNMKHGYDSRVGENGNQLSGGERQRLSIARAILRDAPIILLDEATASLDVENEIAVKKAIANLLRANKTVIMIAHTLSIVQKADKIIVVSQGKIIEEGIHAKLLQNRGKYYSMWNAEQKLSA